MTTENFNANNDISTEELREQCKTLLKKLKNWDTEKKQRDKQFIRNLAGNLGLQVLFLDDLT